MNIKVSPTTPAKVVVSGALIGKTGPVDTTTATALAAFVAQKGAANGLATLDPSGLVPVAQLPPLAISSVAVVASQAGMLALTAEMGDVAIRTDNGKTYILASNSPSTLADWKEITADPAGAAHLNGTETFTGAKTWPEGTFLDKGTRSFDVRAYGAVGDAVKFTDGAITSGAAILTSASSPFTSADVGKIVIITGAGASGIPLNATISSYQSAGQVTLSVNASTTVTGASFAYGTNDTAALIATAAAIRLAGGGRMQLMRNHITNARVYYDRKNMSIECYPGGTRMYVGWDTLSGYGQAVFVFYSDDSVTMRNIRVKGVTFDHMGCRTPGIFMAGNTSTVSVSRHWYFEEIESLNRAGDAGGTNAAIVIYGAYGGVVGSLADVHIDLDSHDNTAGAGTQPYSINILSNDLDGLWVKGHFQELYGTTIAMASGITPSLRKNFNFDISCFRTKKRVAGLGTHADIFDNTRSGFQGIDITGWFNDDNLFSITDDNFHIALYEAKGVEIHHGRFFNSRAVFAPGQSTPNGHEIYGSTFHDNVVIDAISFSDADGQIAYLCTDNAFVRVQNGPILFGYGLQVATKHHGNVFYNCLANTNTSVDYAQSIFLSEMGGIDYDGNIVYDDLGAASKLKYVFTELYTTGPITFPTSYRNNKLMITSNAAAYVATFQLTSSIKHEIIGNTGVKEARIQNYLRGNTAVISALARTDVVSNNWRSDGSRVLENENGSTVMRRTGDYMSGRLIHGQGYAMQFAGAASSYAQITNNAAFQIGALGSPFSIAARIQIPTGYDASQVRYPLFNNGRYYLQMTTSRTIAGGLWGGGNPTSATVLQYDTPYDVLFTWDGTSVATLSINGVVEGVITGTTSSASGNNDLYLGKRNGEAGTEFSGIVDKLEIWNRLLTADEQFVVGNGGIAPASGLVLQLGFDEQSTLDTSATGAAGSTTGTTYVAGIAPPVANGLVFDYNLGDGRTVGTHTAGLFAGPVTALKSATTSVNVSAATAPTAGQVLTAVDSTHATWQAGSGAVSSVAGRTGAVVLAEADITSLVSDLAAKAALASPALTGSPTAPTRSSGDNSTKIATTAYTDAAVGVAIQGIKAKTAVRAGSTANGTLASAYANGSVIDGVTLATGDRILLKNQTTGSENGIYTVNASGAPTRATDADANSEISGMFVFVEEGTTNADTGWLCTNDGTITLGTTALAFVQFSSAGQVAAGTGLVKTGLTLSLDPNPTVTTLNGITVGTGGGAVSSNLGVGYQALNANTTGDSNLAVGYQALKLNTIGYQNVSLGFGTLAANVSGQYNLAIGSYALASNTNSQNVAVGTNALNANVSGDSNTAMGVSALKFSTSYGNTAVGNSAGVSVTGGNSNVFLGRDAGNNGSQRTTPSNSMALGTGSYTYADNQTVIGRSTVTQAIVFGTIVNNHTTAAINSTATATAAQVATGYITSTSAAATTITLPTGTSLGTLLAAVQGTVFDLYVDNTAGANIVTIAANTNAIQSAMGGTLTVPSGVTGQACFRLMFSSATAYTFTRIA